MKDCLNDTDMQKDFTVLFVNKSMFRIKDDLGLTQDLCLYYCLNHSICLLLFFYNFLLCVKQ